MLNGWSMPKNRYMTDVSIIIPSYNHPEIIFQCVRSLLKQKTTAAFEIVVVDSSNAEKQERLNELCLIDPRVRLIKLDKQTFPGAARNVGIENARSKMIALIDADCVANETWLQNIVDNIQDNTILTGVIKNGTKGNAVGTCSYLVEFNNFLEFDDGRRNVDAAATCNFAAPKEVFDKLGGFSDDRAFEDFLFCYRFKKSGGEICQISSIQVSHINKTKLSDVVRNQKMLGRFSAIVRKKHGLPPKIVFAIPLLAFALYGFRYLSIFSRVVRTRHIFKFILYTPIVAYLLFQWSLGFYQGARLK